MNRGFVSVSNYYLPRYLLVLTTKYCIIGTDRLLAFNLRLIEEKQVPLTYHGCICYGPIQVTRSLLSCSLTGLYPGTLYVAFGACLSPAPFMSDSCAHSLIFVNVLPPTGARHTM